MFKKWYTVPQSSTVARLRFTKINWSTTPSPPGQGFAASAENANALSNEATLRCTAAWRCSEPESAASWNVDAGIRVGE